MSALVDLERPHRDLGAHELWGRSLERSRARRLQSASGGGRRRSIVSEALADLDAPALRPRGPGAADARDLSDPELWDFSAACARAKRLAAEPGLLPQVRVAGATLVVAAFAAALPVQGGAQSRARASGVSRAHVEILKLGSRGPAVVRVQRALRIAADGIFGPQTRGAVRAFQKRNRLVVDGIVGPQTRRALFERPARPKAQSQRLIRAWWVAPVQRKLHVAVDGVYGPVTRAAVRSFQKRRGLLVDGIVGPQTLGALGIRKPAAGGGPRREQRTERRSSRGERAVADARRYLGIRYRWGGASPSAGFDCSGFVMFLYAKVGVSLPHNAAAQYRYGRAVRRASLRAGDAVFFDGLGHVGLYLGGGRFIHASSAGGNVKISGLSESWYRSRYVGARRF